MLVYIIVVHISIHIIFAFSGLPEKRHHQHRRVVALCKGERMVQARKNQMQIVTLGQAVQMSRYVLASELLLW